MLRIRAALAALLMTLGPSMAAQPAAFGESFTPADPFAQVAEMKRGVNVLGYDPVWQDSGKGRFTPAMFAKIKTAGFSTVRIVLQTFPHLDSANRLDPVWLKTLDTMVSAALGQGLHVVLDEHDFNLCAKSLEDCRTKVLAVWGQLAPHYKDASNRLVFELLNEPNGAITPEIWQGLSREFLAEVRKTNPARNVVIGGPFWNNLEGLPWLKLPEDDRHLIASVHYYLPRPFTHQGASWDPVNVDLGVTWGTKSEYQVMEEELYIAKTWGDVNKRPVFLGEFGTYDKGPMDSRVKWTAAVARMAEHYGFAWAYWQLDSDFIVYDFKTDSWVKPLLDALIPPTDKK